MEGAGAARYSAAALVSTFLRFGAAGFALATDFEAGLGAAFATGLGAGLAVWAAGLASACFVAALPGAGAVFRAGAAASTGA